MMPRLYCKIETLGQKRHPLDRQKMVGVLAIDEASFSFAGFCFPVTENLLPFPIVKIAGHKSSGVCEKISRTILTTL